MGPKMQRPTRRRRTPEACVTCRRRKTKCDGARPRCRHCSSRDIPCLWGDDLDIADEAAGANRGEAVPRRSRATPISAATVKGSCNADSPSVALPEHCVIRYCLDNFFDQYSSNTFCSFLYKEDIDLHLDLDLEGDIDGENASPAFLLAAVLSLCARHLSARQAKSYFGLDSGLEVSGLYAPMARRMARAMSDKPSVCNIQANLILAVSEFLDNEGSSHWMYAGTATRMAQIMRLNMGFHQRHSLKEREIRRRTMWACVFVDSWICYFLGKTPIPISIVRTFLPGNDASIAFREPSRGLTLETIDAYTGYPSDIGLLPYLTTTISLWSDLVNVTVRNPRFLFKQPPTDPTSPLWMPQDALRKWASNLPSSLQWSQEAYTSYSNIGYGQDFVLMHFLIRSSICAANHAYLPQLDSSSILQDKVDSAGWSLLHAEPEIIAACIDNALATAKIASYLWGVGERGKGDLQTMHAAASLFAISNTLLWLQYSNYPGYADEEGLIEEAQKYFKLVLSIIDSWQGQWKAAERWAYSLRAMRALYRAAYLGELDEAMSVDTTPLSSHSQKEDGTTTEDRYRPQPGDGYPPTESIKHLYDCLRLFATDVSVESQTLQDIWMQLAMGWSQNILSFDETPEYIHN